MWWLVAASPNARPPVLRALADVRGRGGRHRAAADRGRGGRRGGRRGRRRGQATGSESLAYLPPVLVARTGGQLSRYRAAAGRGRGGRRGRRHGRRRGQATGRQSLACLPPVLVARTGGQPWRRATAAAAPPAVRLHRCDRRGLLPTCSRSRSRRAGPRSRPPVPVGMRLPRRDLEPAGFSGVGDLDGVGEIERNQGTLFAPEGSAAARCPQEHLHGRHSRPSVQPRSVKRSVPREVQVDEDHSGLMDVAGREERLACRAKLAVRLALLQSRQDIGRRGGRRGRWRHRVQRRGRHRRTTAG